jgi:hypothetical protein
VRVGAPVEIGEVAHGRRRIVPILGGTVDGPMLKGTVPKFETSVPELQWLARSVFVGVGERFPEEVVVRFFRLD